MCKENVGTGTKIARAVGFNDALYLSKVFRRKFGITPSEYRNQVKNNET